MLDLFFFSQLNSLVPLLSVNITNGECDVKLNVKQAFFKKILFFLKKSELGGNFHILSDLTGADFVNINKRFKCFYNLLSIYNTKRILISFTVNEFDSIESINDIFYNSLWYERELWDMFGIFVLNHLDLRRILTDYGFEGFPLRKNFPVIGFFDITYDFFQKTILFNTIELSQNFNEYNYINPWKI